MTGHQQNPTTGFNLKGDPCAKIDLERLCRAAGINRVRVVDPYCLAECEATLPPRWLMPWTSLTFTS